MDKKYDWSKVQRYYDAGNSYYQCKARFGFARASWGKAVKRGDIKPKSRKMPLKDLLVNGKFRHTDYLKRRLIAESVLKNHCYMKNCPSTLIWVGKPLVFQLDHKNGNRCDNRRKNLRLLCPNCHTQTDTYGSKGKAFKNIIKDRPRAS